jgi:hypothetical protein
MADESRGVAMRELLILFKTPRIHAAGAVN